MVMITKRITLNIVYIRINLPENLFSTVNKQFTAMIADKSDGMP